jgi:hypothetical protein
MMQLIAGRMRLPTLIVLALGCSPPRPMPDDVRIFREIRIEGATIQLGAPLPPEVPRASESDTVVALSPRQFAGAEAIRVHLTTAGIVRSFWFDYRLGSSHEEMVTAYATELGAPLLQPYRRGERAVWEDERTRFELVHDPERSAGTLFSILSDRSPE